MAIFVLIPGAGTDPQVFGETIDALRELGHGGLAPPLPLEDRNAHPSDHARAVASAAPTGGNAVVVGQSLGAFAAPPVADAIGAALLVLLAPMVPAPGETAGEWWRNTGHDEAIADLVERWGPMSAWGAEAFGEVFLHDVDPGVARASARFSGAPGPGMFTEPWPAERWPNVPTRVLCPRDDRLFPTRRTAPCVSWAAARRPCHLYRAGGRSPSGRGRFASHSSRACETALPSARR